jgi:hypothetical protein
MSQAQSDNDIQACVDAYKMYRNLQWMCRCLWRDGMDDVLRYVENVLKYVNYVLGFARITHLSI